MRIRAIFQVIIMTLAVSACAPSHHFHGVEVSGANWGKQFSLPDSQGNVRKLQDFHGKVIVLFFGYLHCPDICPTTLSNMRDAMEQLGPDNTRVQVIFITLDPSRDTPELLAQYVPGFHPSFIGLRGDESATADTAKEFKVFYTKQGDGNHYTIDHSTSSYVFDPEGRLRLVFRHGEKPKHIAEDITALLAGK